METDLTTLTPDVRRLDDMRAVLADQDWAKNAPNADLYYMYRGINEKDGIRYDITTMPCQMLGNEFVKTKGHYHIGGYQEVYTVLEGEAFYLMQKKGQSDNSIEDVYVVHAKEGETIVIPPHYGHITINPSKEKNLKMANWVASACKSNYLPFEQLQGASWHYTTNGWVKNQKYTSVPELRFQEPLKEVPSDLNFLKNN